MTLKETLTHLLKFIDNTISGEPRKPPKSYILSLPTELQAQILSFLSFFDQISVSQVCPLWHNILLETPSSRYPINTNPTLPSIHQIIGGPLNTQLPEETPALWISCTLKNEKIIKYEYAEYNSHNCNGKSSLRTIDISKHEFLDEPILSPFAKVGYSPRMGRLCDADNYKGKLACGFEDFGRGGVYPEDCDTYLPFFPYPPTGALTEAEENDTGIHECPSVCMMDGADGSDVMWEKRFNLTEGLTVREAIEKVVKSLNVRYKDQGVSMGKKREMRIRMVHYGSKGNCFGWKFEFRLILSGREAKKLKWSVYEGGVQYWIP